MSTATTVSTGPTDPKAPWGSRFAVYFRPNPKVGWTAIAHHGTAEGARKLMHKLMATKAGDWCVAPADNPSHKPRLR